MFLHGEVDGALLGQDFDFGDACFDAAGEVVDRLQQGVGLPHLFLRLLEPPLGDVNPPITFLHILVDVVLVVKLKPPLFSLRGGRGEVFFFEVGLVGFGAGAQVLLGVGEEVVRAGAAEVGAADFAVGYGEGGLFGCAGRHELLAH